MTGRAHNGRPRYICAKDPGRPGCGRVAVYADIAEIEARDRILTVLEHTPGMLEWILAKHQAHAAGPGEEDPGKQLRQIEERRTGARSHHADVEANTTKHKEGVTKPAAAIRATTSPLLGNLRYAS